MGSNPSGGTPYGEYMNTRKLNKMLREIYATETWQMLSTRNSVWDREVMDYIVKKVTDEVNRKK